MQILIMTNSYINLFFLFKLDPGKFCPKPKSPVGKFDRLASVFLLERKLGNKSHKNMEIGADAAF